MYIGKLHSIIIINIFKFLDIKTSIKLSESNKKIYKIFEELYPSKKYIKIFPDFIIKLLGGVKEFVQINSYIKKNISVGIQENKMFLKLRYYFRNQEHNDIFIQKNESDYNVWYCKSFSLIFFSHEYDMSNLDEYTEYNIRSICGMRKKVKIYDFMNDINNQLFFYDNINY